MCTDCDDMDDLEKDGLALVAKYPDDEALREYVSDVAAVLEARKDRNAEASGEGW